MKIIRSALFVSLLCLCGCSQLAQTSAPAATSTPSAGQAAFDRMKDLAGIWETQPDSDGNKERVEYKTTVGNQVLLETIFPRTPEEMISVYFLDQGALAMTHYCLIGNQPFLKAIATDENTLVFQFAGGTNITNPEKDSYMSQMTLTFIDDGHIKIVWHSHATNHPDKVLELTRVRHHIEKNAPPAHHHTHHRKHKA